MKIAVPDLVSNSYFPSIAACALGIFEREGLNIDLELIFPVDKAYRALRDGVVDFVGGSAHSMPAAFANWDGARLLAALSQGTYWFLVMRADLKPERGKLEIVKGRKIGAAPMVDLGIVRLLQDSGLDLVRDKITIMPVPGSAGQGVSFGVNAAKALEQNQIDGFWANGMGAEVAVKRGVGKVVIDARRGDGPSQLFGYTLPVLATTAALVDHSIEHAKAAVRAIIATQQLLKNDVARATEVGRKLFPPWEAELIADVVVRDLPYYDHKISPETFAKMTKFAKDAGLAGNLPAYDTVIPPQIRSLWN
jgi:NitT/TauT family transport system substrate-binding protein